MYADNFSSTRDILYLAGALAGLALGLFFSFHKKRLNRAQKSLRVTAGIFTLSVTLLAAAGAFVLSGGAIIYDNGLLIAACCAAAAGLFAALFPETVLFPMVILGGLTVALAACLFLRHPQADSVITIARTTPCAGGALLIAPEYPKLRLTRYNASNFANNQPTLIPARPFKLEYTAALVYTNRLIPLVGGQRRHIPVSLHLVDSQFMRIRLYQPSFLEEAFISVLLWQDRRLMKTQNLVAQTDLNDITPHARHTIYFDGNTLQKKAR